eukprot:scaffold10556_cov141-Skeletonema_menzelii.AAC.2
MTQIAYVLFLRGQRILDGALRMLIEQEECDMNVQYPRCKNPERCVPLPPTDDLLSSTSPLTCYYPRFHQSRTRNN